MTEAEQDDDANAEADSDHQPQQIGTRLGIALVLLSGMLWFSLFVIPFLPVTIGQKAAIGGALFVGVQIAWWSGAALAGPQAVQKLTKLFRGVRVRSTSE